VSSAGQIMKLSVKLNWPGAWDF